ncbi:TetR/AcrR family transcriptional regulator [Companilactobacillus kimchiensis]|uniref:Transcription regulator n=1 Tax=Companilactobacillus kimchiensis TaxID=993692 RepID=A0A0R2LL46_9LACO|nr:TetR/AcrR family transcriptional regulator [Companilactobacillus kimchiensis]KRN99671.1 transcription regulator [Companilactobacillus kimchiensis]
MTKNLQNLRTERAIQNAFITLVNQKGFNHITIGDIAEEALINRQTFYYHYQDKYQLTEIMIDNLVDEYDELYRHYVTTNLDNLGLSARIAQLFPRTDSFWTANRQKVAALFTIEVNDQTLEKELKKRFRRYLPTLLGRQPLPLEETIFPAIILGVIEYVVETGKTPDQAEIIETFNSISTTFK